MHSNLFLRYEDVKKSVVTSVLSLILYLALNSLEILDL